MVLVLNGARILRCYCRRFLVGTHARDHFGETERAWVTPMYKVLFKCFSTSCFTSSKAFASDIAVESRDTIKKQQSERYNICEFNLISQNVAASEYLVNGRKVILLFKIFNNLLLFLRKQGLISSILTQGDGPCMWLSISDKLCAILSITLKSIIYIYHWYIYIYIHVCMGHSSHSRHSYALLVLYTESGKYLLHRVWYIYEQEVKGGHFSWIA